jgi:5-methylcytosine-specific restriction protein A
MVFDPGLNKGEIFDNQQLCSIFKCSPQGGMRRSLRTNSLVIITNKTKNFYKDRWEGNILHYTGMGLFGDQSLKFAQNKTLAESNINGVNVFLFEVIHPKEYIFKGRVRLVKEPYQEYQRDLNNENRLVWIFPMKLMD